MIKAYELRLKAMMDQMDKNNELCVNHQSESVNHEVKDLWVVAKERHILFVEAVKKVKKDVNLKIEEIRQEMTKEVAKVWSEQFKPLN